MKNKNTQIKRIYSKFQQLKSLDPDRQLYPTKEKIFLLDQDQLNQKTPQTQSQINLSNKIQRIQKQRQQQKNQIIYTQSQISKQVAKLKPYLVLKNNMLTTQQLQQLKNKQISQPNYKMMSQLVILQNSKLCQIMQQIPENVINDLVQRQEKQKQGWVFEIFYRSSSSQREDITKKIFICGYAVMTQKVQIYQSLNFQKILLTITPSSITMVKYQQDNNYHIISIEQNNLKIQCGFLNNKKFDLFDRMLFLLKSMSRSTSNRLFQNQLIRSIYAQYEKMQ